MHPVLKAFYRVFAPVSLVYFCSFKKITLFDECYESSRKSTRTILFRPGKAVSRVDDRGGAVIYNLSCFNWIFNGFNELWAELFLNAPVTAKIAVPFFSSSRLSPHPLCSFAPVFRFHSAISLSRKGLLAV